MILIPFRSAENTCVKFDVIERRAARSEARSTSPIDNDLVENPPEITDRLEAKGRYLQDLR